MTNLSKSVKEYLQKKLQTPKPKPPIGKFAFFSIFGGLIGAVTALMSSKKNGEENRKFVKQKAEEVKKNSETHLKDLAEKTTNVTSNLKEKLEENAKNFKDTVSKGLRDISDKIKHSDLQDKVVKIVDKTEEKVSDKKEETDK